MPFVKSQPATIPCKRVSQEDEFLKVSQKGDIIHLMSDPEGNEVEGNIRTRGKTKLTGFPRDLTLQGPRRGRGW